MHWMHFGSSVSIKGDYAVIGAAFGYTNGIEKTGSAYIFKRTGIETWEFTHKVVAPDLGYLDRFSEVSMSSDYVIVGASNGDTDATDTGSAYIFRK